MFLTHCPISTGLNIWVVFIYKHNQEDLYFLGTEVFFSFEFAMIEMMIF